ncbi:uncharacterized protein LOC130998059 [Salvia miltiorrhiza]|uniref:uncharacterized protein LOC130998059 n=1 Tax=Salvia miltiorrhiza TaxID=226208 RepID=UPI0025ABCD72|nr:uncharacterized protein LOC130998059 [Salvia miltiorrhiza]
MEWFDDTSSSSSDEVAQAIIDEIQEHKQLLAQMYYQLALEHVVHHRQYVHCDREAAHLRLIQDYFNDNPTYEPTFFRRRFQMQKELFLRIVEAVQGGDTYFQMSHDARGRDFLTPLQKCTNFPKAWHDAYTCGDQEEPTLILEAVASHNLWILHAFFGVAGSNNDINILNQSPLFSDVLDGTATPVLFEANQRYCQMSYYLCDGIYPEWRCFVKSPLMATNPKEARFKKVQELTQKDVERAFGVFQARWRIIRSPARGWYVKNFKEIMMCCIILHNLIVENEGERVAHWRDDNAGHGAFSSDSSESARTTPICFEEYVQRNAILRDRHIHAQLQRDLIEHVWARFRPLDPE